MVDFLTYCVLVVFLKRKMWLLWDHFKSSCFYLHTKTTFSLLKLVSWENIFWKLWKLKYSLANAKMFCNLIGNSFCHLKSPSNVYLLGFVKDKIQTLPEGIQMEEKNPNWIAKENNYTKEYFWHFKFYHHRWHSIWFQFCKILN